MAAAGHARYPGTGRAERGALRQQQERRLVRRWKHGFGSEVDSQGASNRELAEMRSKVAELAAAAKEEGET